MAHPDTLAMIERFISFDTVSSNSNLGLIEFAKATLEQAAAKVSLTLDGTGKKGNLLASLGPTDVPGLLLSGHTDVVPVEDQVWGSDPFLLSERDGKLHGRGTCDMKGFLAIATAFLLRRKPDANAMPLHIAMSYDEEVGCLGVHDLIADIRARLPAQRLCIVGEPSEMAFVYAHKGKVGGHVSAEGRNAHSSLSHQGVNAVEAVCEAVAFMKGLQRTVRDNGHYNPAFEDPKYTSIQCCMVSGGTAVNVIPASASFDFDVRYLPGENPDVYLAKLEEFITGTLVPEMQAMWPQADMRLQRVPGCAAYWQDPDESIIKTVRALFPGKPLLAVPFGTEAGYFRDAGIPTLICGPGSIDQAHKPDEFVSVDQVTQCENFLDRLVESLSA